MGRSFPCVSHLVEIPLSHPAGALGFVSAAAVQSWQQEIATIWRFTRKNGITEGFHNKMETISRQAYGFRNFQNYGMRVKVLCG